MLFTNLSLHNEEVGPGKAKRSKDLIQAQALLGLLADTRPNELQDVWNEAEGRSGKWSNYMLTGLADIEATVRDRNSCCYWQDQSRYSEFGFNIRSIPGER